MFSPPTEANGVVAVPSNVPASIAATWASLHAGGLESQLLSHLVGEDPETSTVIRAAYLQLCRGGPIGKARGLIDSYLAGQPMPVLDLVTRLARSAYALSVLAESLGEVIAFLAANADGVPIVNDARQAADQVPFRAIHRVVPAS